MSDENLVCPQCGHDRFTQVRIAQIEYTMVYYHGWEEVKEETIDGGDSDTDIACEECGIDVDESDLIDMGAQKCEECGNEDVHISYGAVECSDCGHTSDPIKV